MVKPTMVHLSRTRTSRKFIGKSVGDRNSVSYVVLGACADSVFGVVRKALRASAQAMNGLDGWTQ